MLSEMTCFSPELMQWTMLLSGETNDSMCQAVRITMPTMTTFVDCALCMLSSGDCTVLVCHHRVMPLLGR